MAAWCPGCKEPRRRGGQFLCASCFNQLPALTRQRLRDDYNAAAVLRRATELLEAVKHGTPLEKIQVAA